jgi:hypothetical protein
MDGIADGEDVEVAVDADRSGAHNRPEEGDFALDTVQEFFIFSEAG